MRVRLAIICAFLVLTVSPSQGQWQSVGQFDAPLTAIKFLDDLGYPLTGFVGLSNGGVWKTGDGGGTWINVTPPGEKGPVSSFTFKSTTEGWFSTRESRTTTNVFHTTDGGSTWTGLFINRERPCIYYNSYSKLLFTTSLSSASLVSGDFGAGWSPIVTAGMNSIDFSDGQFGVMSTYNDYFYVTGDGGFSWSPTKFGNECWKPLAVKGVHVIFAVSEVSKYVYRSTDLGNTWSTMGMLGPKPTGDIEGECSQLYVQTDSGVYVSVDEGVSWASLGGPSNQSDTRFVVVGHTIFAGDLHGGLLRYNDQSRNFQGRLLITGGNGTVGNALWLYANGCQPDTTQVAIMGNSACLASRLDSATYVTTAGLRVPVLDQLPKLLLPDSSYGFPLYFRPTGGDGDTLTLRLHFTENGAPFDTTVILIAQGIPSLQLVGDRPAINLEARVNCTTVKTTINFQNGKCDSVTLDDVTFADSVRFGLASTNIPIKVGPKGVISLTVFGHGEAKGTYRTIMTLHLHIRGSKFVLTEPVSLQVDADGTVETDIQPARLNFSPTSLCGKRDNTFYIVNPACAKYSITKISWITGPPSYTIVSQPVLPRTLLSGEQDSVVVRFAPQQLGTSSASLRVSLSADSLKQDTIINITGSGYTISKARLSEDLAEFDTILACSSLDRYAYVRNESCDATDIVEVIKPADASFVVLEPTAPITVPPGDSVRIHVLLDPSTHGGQPGLHLDSVELRLRNKGGSEQALDLKLNALVLPEVRRVSLSAQALVDSSLTPCSTRDTSFVIRNLGTCDTLELTTLAITGSSWFTATTHPALPASLLPGDSLIVAVHTNADPLGSSQGSLRVQGRGFDTSIMLMATVQPRTGSELAATYRDTLYPTKLCSTRTGYVRYQNQSCGAITIDSAWASPIDSARSKFSILAGNLPIQLLPGDTADIPILFDANATGDSAAVLHVRTAERRPSDTVALSGVVLGAPRAVTLSLALNGANRASVPIASIAHVTVELKDAVGDSSQLTQINTTLNYDDNVLTPGQATGLNGWTVSNVSKGFGTCALTLSRSTPATSPAGQPIADVPFATTVGDALASGVTQAGITFNNDDATYKHCQLTALPSTDSLVIAIDPFCGDSLYLRQVLGQPILSSVSIRPNPVHEASSNAVLQFDTRARTNLLISMVDARGTELFTISLNDLEAGEHIRTLPIRKLASGAYFLRLLTAGDRQVMKVIVR